MKTNYLCGLFLLCVLVWGRSEAHAEKPLKTLDLYLCIGQSNMAGRGLESPDIVLRIWGLRNMTIAIL